MSNQYGDFTISKKVLYMLLSAISYHQ